MTEPDGPITCPFCRETEDWDLLGYKMHLERWCEPYLNLNVAKELDREQERRNVARRPKVHP